MKKRIITVFFTIMMLAIAGCAGSDVVRVKVTGDKMTDLRKGQTLEIELEANPTTGYMWEIAASVNEGVLRQIDKYRYVQKSGLIGGGGIQIYRFEGLKKGRAKLVFEYRRPWEKEKKPAEKYVVQVVVH